MAEPNPELSTARHQPTAGAAQVAIKFIERNVDKITKNVRSSPPSKHPSIRSPISLHIYGIAAIYVQVEREIINHSCLIHPHIVRFRECFLTPKYLGIAMEYAAGGDLYRYVAAK